MSGVDQFCLFNLTYGEYKSLIHLANFVPEKSLTSFILVYYIKPLGCAVGFDCFLAQLLFAKGGAQASRRQRTERGTDTDGQTGRIR